MHRNGNHPSVNTRKEGESLGLSSLSVVLIAPDDERRRIVSRSLSGQHAAIARELSLYPQMEDIVSLAKDDHDVIVVDLHPDPEKALDVIESICSRASSCTVIAYAARPEPELLVRCMRAGAREFLSDPLSQGAIAEALVRASARRDDLRRQKKPLGKVFVFIGAKGGCGVTTIAANFAAALAAQAAGRVALVDLDLQLGDAALTLAVTSRFSVADALENPERLDSDFLSVLMSKHSSGLSILAAPDKLLQLDSAQPDFDPLLRVVRQDFSYVVVDAGSYLTAFSENLFKTATAVYMITQAGIAELRNANRLIGRFFSDENTDKLEIVLNRYLPKNAELDDAAIGKALTRAPKWKVPNDFAAVRRAQHSGTPLVSDKNAISTALNDMARAVSGQTANQEKRGLFSLFA